MKWTGTLSSHALASPEPSGRQNFPASLATVALCRCGSGKNQPGLHAIQNEMRITGLLQHYEIRDCRGEFWAAVRQASATRAR